MGNIEFYNLTEKNMNKYIFLTFEWFTYQPNSEAIEPDAENVQMLWIWEWNTKSEWFEDFKIKNQWITKTNFNEVFCHELKDDKFDYFCIK